jgi:hypothetical protein
MLMTKMKECSHASAFCKRRLTVHFSAWDLQMKSAAVLSKWAILRLDTPVKVRIFSAAKYLEHTLIGTEWTLQRAADKWMFRALKRGLGQVP